MSEPNSEAIDFRAASESSSEYRKVTEQILDIPGACTVRQAGRVLSVRTRCFSG